MTLMGYSRGTTAGNLNSAIKYQDIQGIAVLNNRHTTHHFNRYVVDENRYLHFCFYCDTVDSRTSIISGSSQMAIAASCLHNYQPMVSAGERHWLKCTECYKVVESDFYIRGVSNGGNINIEITGLIDPTRATITIPREIGGQNVTHIGNGAFSGLSNLTSVTFESPSNVQTIGNSAFVNTGVVNLSLPSSVTSIGDNNRFNLDLDTQEELYVYSGEYCPITFTAPANGIYSIETFGSVQNEFDSALGVGNYKSDGINQKLIVQLKKGLYNNHRV